MADNTVTVGLLLRLEAAPGRENDIQSLLGLFADPPGIQRIDVLASSCQSR